MMIAYCHGQQIVLCVFGIQIQKLLSPTPAPASSVISPTRNAPGTASTTRRPVSILVRSRRQGRSKNSSQNRNVCSDSPPDLWYRDPVRRSELVTLALKEIADNDIKDNKLVAAEGVCHSRRRGSATAAIAAMTEGNPFRDCQQNRPAEIAATAATPPDSIAASASAEPLSNVSNLSKMSSRRLKPSRAR